MDVYEGPREYISDADRPGLIEAARRDIATYCDEPDSEAAQAAAHRQRLRAKACEAVRVKLEAALRPGARSSSNTIAELERRKRYFCADE